MQFRAVLTVAALSVIFAACPPQTEMNEPVTAEQAAAESERLQGLFETYFEETLERNPILATAIGDPRYNDRLPNFLSPEYQAEDRAFQERWLETMGDVDRDLLDGQDRLSYDIFVYDREEAIEGFRFPGELMPIDQFTNIGNQFAQLGSGQSIQPFATEKDYRDFLKRIPGGVAIIDQAIVNMRLGVEKGVTQPRPLMEKVIPQLAAHVVSSPDESVFYRPVANFPEGIDEAVQVELREAYEAAIRDQLVPVYRRLHDFVRDEYLPACRESVAISALPDGPAWYAYLVKTQITTGLSPDEIHQFGLDEVARIRAEMEAVKEEVGFEGTLAEFFAFLESEDQFYFDSEEELLGGYREVRDRIDATLPKLFDIFPEAGYEVRPVPDFMAESSAGAFYQPATPDGSRPGVFYVNTFNLDAQPRFLMETLSIHEASPGHHFQISIAQEVEDLPKFRRFGGTTAYFEGWALYAESLGKELGLFTDPYQYYGRLADEMLRAMRLVVDTGLHDESWSRQQAIDYMLDNSSMADSDVVAEVERYIAIPGQALAYKVGQRVISGLRAEAEERLGGDFDIKAFHRAVLIDGALPMDVLRIKMREWMEQSV
jgi:uncharacterized protein (DUF885 family)